MRQIDQRLVRNVAATLRWVNTDADGVEAAASGSVTVTVVDAAGTAVTTDAAASAVDGKTGHYEAALAADDTASLGVLTATWSDDGTEIGETTAEVVSRRLATIGDVHRIARPNDQLTQAELIDLLLEAEEEAELICNRGLCRHRAVETHYSDGSEWLTLDYGDIASVASVTVNDTALSAAELADLDFDNEDPQLRNRNGWRRDVPIVVTYEYGFLRPPLDITRAVAFRVRDLATTGNSIMTLRSDRYVDPEGGDYDLSRSSAYKTGLRIVDDIYERYSRRTDPVDGEGPPPAFATFDWDPTVDTLFHSRR